ncbi:MAG TPA: endonuclease III [Victivallales bacterium]|nr:endonuclease III [Victivallales bacterium]
MKKLCIEIHERLYAVYGNVDCPLHHKSPFQLMISAVLSAQCTDERVNKTVPTLYAEYPDAKSMSKAKIEDVEEIIKPVGLYRTKAKNIVNTSIILTEQYDGKLPSDMESLTKLPGLGRKTANVVIAHVFHGAGFAVDTHVNRLLNRIGIVNIKDPVKIEMKIRKLVKPEFLGNFSLSLIMHGRNRCKARKPDCKNCEISDLCKKKL